MSDSTPTLIIDASVSVDGEIILERPVNLEIENQAIEKKVVVSYRNAQ
jgi:hypothetical protein